MTQWSGVVPIEIQCGREGLWGIANTNLIPIGGAITLRNAIMSDHTWRTGGGAVKFGVALAGTPSVNHGIDFWPTPTVQRTVVSSSDGKIYKDDGTGNAWVALVTGLSTNVPYNPFMVLGGAETVGRSRRCFYCDGINAVRVLLGDAGTDAAITAPAAALTATPAAGAGLSVGVYQYVYTYMNAQGETTQSPTASGTTTGGNQQMNLTGITTGGAGTTKRNVYRTKVGGSVFFLLTTITDNVTTTFTDNTSDVNLGSLLPPTNNTTPTTHILGRPPADWTGINQPIGLAVHQGRLWGWGNPNNPHTLYYSNAQTGGEYMEDFLSGDTGTFPVFTGEGQYIIAALSFKGGLMIWKYPNGVYFLDTTTAGAAPSQWTLKKVGNAGSGGPNLAVLLENDVLWVAPDGSYHLGSATYAIGSVHASDIAYRKLGQFNPVNFNLSVLAQSDLIYYTQKREVHLAVAGAGSTKLDHRLVLDLNREQDQGERWLTWDRDICPSLFLRRGPNTIPQPVLGDDKGQVWLLDQGARDKAGMGYTFEFFLADTDFSQFVPQWAGKWKNLRYLQVEWVPGTAGTLTLNIFRDGIATQTITQAITGGGLILPFNLPGIFGPQTLQNSIKRQLLGRCHRLSIQGLVTGVDQDISISRLIVGVEVGE